MQPDYGIFLIQGGGHQSKVSVRTWGRPSFQSKPLLGPRPKLRRGSMWQSTGQDRFQAVAWLLLIPSFRQMRAVKPGSPLGSPGAAREEQPCRLTLQREPKSSARSPTAVGKAQPRSSPSRADCPKQKGICPPLFRLGLGADAGAAGEARPCRALPCPAPPCWRRCRAARHRQGAVAGGQARWEKAGESQRAGGCGLGAASLSAECCGKRPLRPQAEIGRLCPLSLPHLLSPPLPHLLCSFPGPLKHFLTGPAQPSFLHGSFLVPGCKGFLNLVALAKGNIALSSKKKQV